MSRDPELLLQNIETAPEQVAVIREAECIGCTKCIQACPVDAIIGANKQMHTVMSDVCIGCGLCIPPCPVDCIDLSPTTPNRPITRQQFADRSRERYQQHQTRIKRQAHEFQQPLTRQTLTARQSAIQAAIARVRSKKA